MSINKRDQIRVDVSVTERQMYSVKQYKQHVYPREHKMDMSKRILYVECVTKVEGAAHESARLMETPRAPLDEGCVVRPHVLTTSARREVNAP